MRFDCKGKNYLTLTFILKTSDYENQNYILLLAFTIMLPATSYSQVGNLLKNKLNKVVNAGAKTTNKEVDNQIDTAVNKDADNAKDKAATRIENNKQKEGQPSQASDEGSQGQSGAGFGKLFGNKIDLKYNEDYGFTSQIIW